VEKTQPSLPHRHDVSCSNQCSIPAALAPFAKLLLLRGESLEECEAFRCAIFIELNPKTNVEWLYALEFAESWWELLRYRRLRQKCLEMERTSAIQNILRKCEGAGLPRSMRDVLEHQSRIIAAEWRSDPNAAREIEARLAHVGIDRFAIEPATIAQSQSILSLFGVLIESAERRRLMIFRELHQSSNNKISRYRIA
jgi:hypothetical protein